MMTSKKSPAGKPAAAARSKKSSKLAKTTKLARLEAMLRRPDGATIEQLGKALDWQSHSVRGAIAGALKEKGCVVTSTVDDGKPRVYRIS
jgi:Protein of unknown function (DUF3489)